MFSGFIFFLFSLRTQMSKSQLSNTYPAHAGADIRRKTETEPSAVVAPELLLLLLLLLLRCRLRCCGGSTRPHRYTDTPIHRYILGSIHFLCSPANTQSFTGTPCMSYYVHMCSVFMILLSYSPIYASPVLLILVNYVCKLVNDIVLKLAEY